MQMATVEMSTASTEGDQKEKMLPPSADDSPPVLNDASVPLNFSELTPCQFGISVQSFTPASLSDRKGEKTDPYLMLHRRVNTSVLCIDLPVLSHHCYRP